MLFAILALVDCGNNPSIRTYAYTGAQSFFKRVLSNSSAAQLALQFSFLDLAFQGIGQNDLSPFPVLDPGEPDVIEALLSFDTTPEQIRELCKQAVMSKTVEVEQRVFKDIEIPAWPIPPGSADFPVAKSYPANGDAGCGSPFRRADQSRSE